MGVPGLFRNIVTNHKETYYWKNNEKISYLFMDFNANMHSIIARYMSENKEKLEKLTKAKIETLLITEIINEAIKIRKVINPTKLLYIALDGVVPMGKMHQQRSRRYKATTENSSTAKIWDKSGSLSPQTVFMKKFSKKMKSAISSSKFGDLKVIFSDSSEPGEGEHKIIPYIKMLIDDSNKNKKNKKKEKKEKKENSPPIIKIKIKNGGAIDKNDNVCIMSPDADLIVLSLVFFQDKNILILKEYDGDAKNLKLDLDDDVEYFYVSVREYQKILFKKLDIDPMQFDLKRVVADIMMIFSFGGNDFTKPFPFMKLKDTLYINNKRISPFDYVLKMYRKILYDTKEYLVDEQSDLNISFFLKIIEEIGKIEQDLGQNRKREIDRLQKPNSNQIKNQLKREEDSKLSEEDIIENRITNAEYYSPLHPEYKKYKYLFTGKRNIDYYANPSHWKNQYYSHFFNINQNDYNEYKTYIKKIVHEYVKSLVWSQKYYFGLLPSWDYYYHFRVAPFASDIYNTLKNIKNIDFKFELGKPVSSQQQLAMILPPQKANLLLKKNQKFLTSSKSPIIQYYPTKFELDVVDGRKKMYSEVLLPKIDINNIKKYIV
jgi:5'-3' exonuclease